MADTPEVPDLKKALENKPPDFAWTQRGTAAKAAASAASPVILPRAQSARVSLMAQGRGKTALIAVLATAGAVGATYAAFQFSGTTPGRSVSLGGVSSSMKIRFARPSNPMGNIVPEKVESSERMLIDMKGGAVGEAAEADAVPADKAADGKGGPGGKGAVGAPMNYDESPSSHKGTGGAAGGGGAAGLGKDGAQGDAGGAAGGFAGGGASKLGAPFGNVKFQGMKRISSSSGFRGIQGQHGAFNKTTQTGGSSTLPVGTSKGDAASGGSVVRGGKGTGAAGVQSGQGAGGGSGSGAGAGSAGGGGAGGGEAGGGGGGEAGGGEAPSVADSSAKISDLLEDAKKDREKAEEHKKLAIAAAALSNHLAAAYEYKQYEKKLKASDEKKDEAQRLTMEMAGSVAP
jgi:hypothetical protein